MSEFVKTLRSGDKFNKFYFVEWNILELLRLLNKGFSFKWY